MQEVHPQNGFILFNTAQECQRGAFKSMREGQIDLVGPCPFLSTPAGGHATTVASVALKQPYLPNHNSTSNSSMSMVSTLCLSPDDQVKELAADSLSIQWAGALLQDVYDFIAEYHRSHAGVTCPVTIPQFRFVTSGLAMTNIPGTPPKQKEVFLVEELIQQSDGPWRKYINNCSSKPCHFSDQDNFRRSQFLAFCQHVQYWRTSRLVFTSDFQGEYHPNLLIVCLTDSVA